MLFWMVGISVVVALIILRWYYHHNLEWQIKFLRARLNKTIRCQRSDQRVVQSLLKDSYAIANEGMTNDHSALVYQTLDLLKLAFGYGLVRPGESTRLMAIGIGALTSNKPDIAGFVIDTFRPLIRQLSPADVVVAIDQLTLIGVVSLKKKHNFLAAKVVECILFIMDQTDGAAEHKVLVSAIKSLKTLGILALRRRDAGLFREVNMRLSAWLVANPRTHHITVEIASMFTAWLYRIIWSNETVLFTVIVDVIFKLIEVDIIRDDGIELIIDELGDVAASASLNPNSLLASLILEFLFKLANERKVLSHWIKVIGIAGRVAKLAVDRHGITVAFLAVHPLLEFGRNLLWTELRFVESMDEIRRQLLFRTVRESLIIFAYAARQNLLGSTGETIVDVFKCWIKHPNIMVNPKSIKKYCQLLLLFWLKNKRQAKKYMPCDTEFMEPILFSSIERQRLDI